VNLTTEQWTLLIAAGAAMIYAIAYAVRTTADVSSKRAEKDRLAAEVAAKLADAVSAQLSNLAAEVNRLTKKLDTTEGKLDDANAKIDVISDALRDQQNANVKTNDGLEMRNQKLREGLVKDGDRKTLDAVLDQDDKDKLDQQRKP
jgi:hypothetical protein